MDEMTKSLDSASKGVAPGRAVSRADTGPAQLAVTRARVAHSQAVWALVAAYAYQVAQAVRSAFPQAAAIELDTAGVGEPGAAAVRLIAVRDGRGQLVGVAGQGTQRMIGVQGVVAEAVGGILAVVPDRSAWRGRRVLVLADYQAW